MASNCFGRFAAALAFAAFACIECARAAAVLEGVNPAASIMGDAQVVHFRGTGVGENDEIKFVDSASVSCDDQPANGTSIVSLAAADCSKITLCETSASAGYATVVVREERKGLRICFKESGSSMFTLQTGLFFSSVTPSITAISPNTFVAGMEKSFEITGTVGLSALESVHWVDDSAVDCESSPSIQGSIAAVSSAQGLESDEYQTGKSIILATFENAPLPRHPWKLCYKFGYAGTIMFPEITIRGFRLDSVTLVHAGTPKVGEDLVFDFSGTGISDADTAKWISPSAEIDADCNAMVGLTVPIVSSVKAMRAKFNFGTSVDGAALCYKFGNEPYKLYKGIDYFDASFSEADAEYSALRRTSATLELALDMPISLIPSGSGEEALFKDDLVDRISAATGASKDRLHVVYVSTYELKTIVRILADPPFDTYDILATQVVSLAAALALDPSSKLAQIYSDAGAPFVDAKPLGETVEDGGLARNLTSFRLRKYAPSGQFEFGSVQHSVIEGLDKVLQVSVTRNHGSSGNVRVYYSIADGTAMPNVDYAASSGYLTFLEGETEKSIDISIVRITEEQRHFSWFTLELSLPEGIMGISLGDRSSTLVRIFDYGDGVPAAQSEFNLEYGTSRDPVALAGWSVVDNGESQTLSLDVHGLLAYDVLVGRHEYNEACDYAGMGSKCGFSCEYSESYPRYEVDGTGDGVVEFDGTSYAATSSPIADFPDEEITVSMWIKTSTLSAGAVFFSYQVDGAAAGTHEIALANPSNLAVIIRGSLDENRIEGSAFTGINLADGAWHFLSVSWGSHGGRIFVYVDALISYTDTMMSEGVSLKSGGSVVIGQAQASGACHSTESSACQFEPGTGFEGRIQNMRIFDHIRTTLLVGRDMEWPYTAYQGGLVTYWRFAKSTMEHSDKGDTFTENLAIMGRKQTIAMSSGASIADDVPSLNPDFPCVVHNNTFYYVAPESYSTAIRSSYGGRLIFEMKSSSFNGVARNGRGFVQIVGGGKTISSTLPYFDIPGTKEGWMGYSITLREDAGWVKEPTGTPADFSTFYSVIRNATELRLRGDNYKFSGSDGWGMETTYLNRVRLYSL